MASSPSRPASGVARRMTVGAVLLLLALGACSGEEPGSASADLGSASTGPAIRAPGSGEPADETTRPTSTPAPSTAVPARPPAPLLGRRARGLRAGLLTADRVPRLSAGSRWRSTGAGTTEEETFSLCQPFSLSAIGAEQVRHRTFVDARPPRRARSRGPARAAHLVARFPDRRTVRRAGSVLESWHRQCQRRVARDVHRVRVEERVVVEGLPGPASWYRTRVRTRPEDRPVVELTGTVQIGERISVVVLRHRRGGYERAPGEDAIVSALRRAAALS